VSARRLVLTRVVPSAGEGHVGFNAELDRSWGLLADALDNNRQFDTNPATDPEKRLTAGCRF
jgi:hypothetical protein